MEDLFYDLSNFAAEENEWEGMGLKEVVEKVKPDILIGLSGQGGIFTGRVGYELFFDNDFISLSQHTILGGVDTCSEGSIICFLKVPLACLGSMEAEVQPNGLGNSQKTVYKIFGTNGRPT